MKTSFSPDYCIHPGEYLEEIIQSRDLKKKDVSERLDITDKTMSQILNRTAYIDPERALKLEKVLGVSATIWNNMNSNYRLYEARKNEAESLSRSFDWLNKFPVRDLIKNGFLPDIKNKQDLLVKLLEFFGVSSPDVWETHYTNLLKQVCCKKSEKYEANKHHVISWLRAGEVRAEEIKTGRYGKDAFKKVVEEIRGLTTERIEVSHKKMITLCAQSGVALVFVPEFGKTHIWGITRWLNPEKALIVMSLRYKWNDHFWFTFFHEAGHIILHGKKDIFVDENGTDKTMRQETQANEFAGDTLMPESEYMVYIERNDFTPKAIREFAGKVKIHPGIVAGRLAHETKIPHPYASTFKEKFDFANKV